MTAYGRVAQRLREQILAGEWTPGQQLPTERALCDRFDASRITIRRALDILESEQLIDRRQGSGTFVAAPSERKIPLLNTDFTGSIARHAPDLERRLIAFAWRKADPADAKVLGVFPGEPVLHAVRQDLLRGRPVAVDRTCLARLHADRLTEADLTRIDFLTHWERTQRFTVHRCRQTIDACRAVAPVSRQLEVRTGDPVLRETSVFKLADDRCPGFVVTHYRHDCFRFDVTIMRQT